MPFRTSLTPVRPWLILIALALLQFLIAVDVTVVNVALPSIGADFGVPAHTLTWVVVGYTITGGGLLMLGGRLSDVIGRRRLLLIGALIFGAASLLAGVAPSFEVLVIARLLQGVGEALASPAAMSIIILSFPEGPARSRALAVWAAVSSLGLVLGLVLSGILTEAFGWRSVFLVAVPFVAVVLVAAFLLVPPDAPISPSPIDLPGSVLLTAAPLLFAFGVIQFGEMPMVATASLVVGVVAAVAFVGVEKRRSFPLIPPEFFRHRSRVQANLATALLSAALSTSFLLYTFQLQDRLGLSPLQSGLMMVPLAVFLIAATLVIPPVLDKFGPVACALLGISVAAMAMVLIAVVSAMALAAWTLIPSMLLIAAGMGFGLIGLQYIAVSGTTGDDAGVASGVQRAADQLGGATGVSLFIGIGFSPVFTGAVPFIFSGGFAVAGLVLAAICVARVR